MFSVSGACSGDVGKGQVCNGYGNIQCSMFHILYGLEKISLKLTEN